MEKVRYPLKISNNRRFLTDQNGAPFLLQGDAAWSLLAQTTKEDAELYLQDRAKKGFNSILVNLIEHWFATDPPKNAYGEEPFKVPGNFSSPNENYFEYVDWVIEKAAQFDIQVMLAPIYLGAIGGQLGGDHDQGWIDEVLAESLSNCLKYGLFLGQRYSKYDNILWIMAETVTLPLP